MDHELGIERAPKCGVNSLQPPPPTQGTYNVVKIKRKNKLVYSFFGRSKKSVFFGPDKINLLRIKIHSRCLFSVCARGYCTDEIIFIIAFNRREMLLFPR